MNHPQPNTWIEIDKKALTAHVAFFKKALAPSKLCLVVKSNAYGHGIEQIYQCLQDLDVHSLAVAYLDEAKLLRSLGHRGRILHLAPCFANEFSAADALDVEILISSPEQLHSWLSSEHQPAIHLKINSGLNRQGIDASDIKTLQSLLSRIPAERLRGICSHFADVEDQSESDYAKHQITRFKNALSSLSPYLPTAAKTERHLSASAAALLLEDARFDFCRVGISLYGLWPSELVKKNALANTPDPLRPVLSWYSRVHALRDLVKGDKVGYGCTFLAPKPMRIAILPLGYADGLSRQLQNHGGGVYIRGKFCKIVGRVSMNITTVDVTDVKNVCEGERVSLISPDSQSAETLAACDQTIHYELLTRIPRHIPRILCD